jgi:hypothetical protein
LEFTQNALSNLYIFDVSFLTLHFLPTKYAMVLQHGPFSLHTMLEGSWLHKMAFPTPMVWPLDESQGSSPLQGRSSWLMCKVGMRACVHYTSSTLVGRKGEPGPNSLHAMLDTRATPKSPAALALKNTSPTYSEGIQGWDLWWLELLEALDASLPPATSASSSSSRHKSQPCIPSKYIGLVFLRAGAAGLLGVAMVWGTNGVCERKKMDVKSTWIPTWHQMDHVSWSLRLLSKTTSWR